MSEPNVRWWCGSLLFRFDSCLFIVRDFPRINNKGVVLRRHLFLRLSLSKRSQVVLAILLSSIIPFRVNLANGRGRLASVYRFLSKRRGSARVATRRRVRTGRWASRSIGRTEHVGSRSKLYVAVAVRLATMDTGLFRCSARIAASTSFSLCRRDRRDLLCDLGVAVS